MKEPKIRKIVTNLEEVFYEGGADMPVENGEKKSIKTVSVAAVIKNPYAGKWQEDLSELTEYGEYLGDLLARKGAELLGAENVETYGKGCLVGVDGELEHSSAMLHPKAGKPIRDAIGGGKSIIPSNEKVAGVGASLDISCTTRTPPSCAPTTAPSRSVCQTPPRPMRSSWPWSSPTAAVPTPPSTAPDASAAFRNPKPSARMACADPYQANA